MMDIKQIRASIEGPSEDARFAAWLELYSSTEDVAKQEVQRIISSKDPVQKILFSRFLAHINESLAVSYLVLLLEDSSKEVFEATAIAFEKNIFVDKLDHLLPLIFSKRSITKHYAIEMLSSNKRYEILEPLIDMLSTDDEELLIMVLTALRYIPSRGLVPHVFPFLNDKREEVRFRALLIFDVLNEGHFLFTRRVFIEKLNDLSALVRQTALWALRKMPSRWDLKFLMDLSQHDPDPMIRHEAVKGLAYFPTASVIRHLLEILAENKVVMVGLKVESTLLSMPHHKLLKHLKRNLNHKNTKVQTKALLLLSLLRIDVQDIFNIVTQRLEKATQDPERIPYIQALGNLGQRDGIPILERFLSSVSIVSYFAMLSLTKLYDQTDTSRIIQVLNTPTIDALTKQVLFKFLSQKEQSGLFGPELENAITPFLAETNQQVRYVSGECLKHATQQSSLDHLCRALIKEQDPHTKDMLVNTITSTVISTPQILLRYLRDHLEDADATQRLLKTIVSFVQKHDRPLDLIPGMLRPPIRILATPYKSTALNIVLSLVIKRQLSLVDFLPVIDDIEDLDLLLESLVDRLDHLTYVSLSLPTELLFGWMVSKSKRCQLAIIRLLGHSVQSTIVPFLTSNYCDSLKDESFRKSTSQSLNRILGLSYD